MQSLRTVVTQCYRGGRSTLNRGYSSSVTSKNETIGEKVENVATSLLCYAGVFVCGFLASEECRFYLKSAEYQKLRKFPLKVVVMDHLPEWPQPQEYYICNGRLIPASEIEGPKV